MVDTRIQEGRRITRRYAGWAAGAGLIPLPFVDMAGLMATQLSMLRSLAKLYDVPFQQGQARAVLASLVASAAPRAIAITGLPSLVKLIPVFGNVLGMIVMPTMAVAATIGIGEVFIRHFTSGGTLDNADADMLAEGIPAETASRPPVVQTAPPVEADADEAVTELRRRGELDPIAPVVEMAATHETNTDAIMEPTAPAQDPPSPPPARGRSRRGAAPSQSEEE